jgi:DNA-binding response OmpR family regulator
MKHILIIEDDRAIVELLSYQLAREGFQVGAAFDGPNGLSVLKDCPPDLLVLDVMLPGISGLQILGEARKLASLSRLPILMLTARSEEGDRILALEMGADDYVTKPFSPRELVARIRALLWRTQAPSAGRHILRFGKLVIDRDDYRVSVHGRFVSMSVLEFRLLYHLASHPDRVFTRDQLLDAIWGPETFVTPRSVDVCVRRLREKVERDPENPQLLRTIHGAGYLFEAGAR